MKLDHNKFLGGYTNDGGARHYEKTYQRTKGDLNISEGIVLTDELSGKTTIFEYAGYAKVWNEKRISKGRIRRKLYKMKLISKDFKVKL